MKNLLSICFLAFFFVLALSSCHYFNKPKTVVADSALTDTNKLDTLKSDTLNTTPTALNPDSVQQKH